MTEKYIQINFWPETEEEKLRKKFDELVLTSKKQFRKLHAENNDLKQKLKTVEERQAIIEAAICKERYDLLR